MEGIIFVEIKKMLGISEDDEGFDTDILIGINSALTSLSALGVGPRVRLAITKETTWSSVNADDNKMLESIKTFVYLTVRLAFDPPQNSFLVSSMENQIKKIGWELSVLIEED